MNKKGAGQSKKLAADVEIYLTLFYLRHMPIFEVLAMMFEVSRTTANDIFHYWLSILRDLLREQQSNFSEQQSFTGDKAYLGAERTTTPQKKPPKRELTPEQKESNKLISQSRIYIEHLIRLVKIFRVAGERFRLNSRTYQQVMLVICGLVRLRIGAFQFSF